MKFSKLMKGILLGIFILALSGCGGSKNEGAKNTDNYTANVSDSHSADNQISEGKGNQDEPETYNADGENLISSSDLQGSVTEFSDSGCVVSPVINDEDENMAIGAAPGYESEENNVTISYKTDCIFQKADINPTTGQTMISNVSISDIKKQTSLIIYGDFKDAHNLTAEKVIIVRYEWD